MYFGQKLPKSAGGDSFDFSPVILGKKVAGPIRTTTIMQTGNGLLALRQGDWKLLFVKNKKTKGKKINLLKAPVELYNLIDDPYEEKNLAKKDPKRATDMRKLLVALLEKGHSK